jgi:hypothetical protein
MPIVVELSITYLAYSSIDSNYTGIRNVYYWFLRIDLYLEIGTRPIVTRVGSCIVICRYNSFW